jgi:hypothetical protein
MIPSITNAVDLTPMPGIRLVLCSLSSVQESN